jgi:hypothetical protein
VKNKAGFLISLVVLAIVAIACNMGTANLSSWKLSTDKDGKEEATNFKSGDTINGRAQVASNGGKVTVKMYMTADDAPGLKKGDTLKGSDVSVEINNDGVALYTLPIPQGMTAGKYIVTADMINDAGEKKDSKSVNITIAAGPASSKDSDDDDK